MHHIEEIKNAGYEMPSVNQIEVIIAFTSLEFFSVWHLILFLSVTPLFSTNGNSQILQGEQHRRAGILSYSARKVG